MARLSLVPAFLNFATSIFSFWMFFSLVHTPLADRVHDFMMGIDMALLGTWFLFLAWEWGYTEVIHFRYDKRRRLLLIVVFLPLFIVVILSLLLSAFL